MRIFGTKPCTPLKELKVSLLRKEVYRSLQQQLYTLPLNLALSYLRL